MVFYLNDIQDVEKKKKKFLYLENFYILNFFILKKYFNFFYKLKFILYIFSLN